MTPFAGTEMRTYPPRKSNQATNHGAANTFGRPLSLLVTVIVIIVLLLTRGGLWLGWHRSV